MRLRKLTVVGKRPDAFHDTVAGLLRQTYAVFGKDELPQEFPGAEDITDSLLISGQWFLHGTLTVLKLGYQELADIGGSLFDDVENELLNEQLARENLEGQLRLSQKALQKQMASIETQLGSARTAPEGFTAEELNAPNIVLLYIQPLLFEGNTDWGQLSALS